MSLEKFCTVEFGHDFYTVFVLLIFREQTLNWSYAWRSIGKSSIYVAVFWWPGSTAVLVGKLCTGILAGLLLRCPKSLTCEHIIIEESPDLILRSAIGLLRWVLEG